jgi:hypothetical protein
MQIALTAPSCAVALAARGSSSKPSTSASNSDAALQFARCMRAHGVNNPLYKSAENACQHYFSRAAGGGSPSQSQSGGGGS